MDASLLRSMRTRRIGMDAHPLRSMRTRRIGIDTYPPRSKTPVRIRPPDSSPLWWKSPGFFALLNVVLHVVFFTVSALLGAAFPALQGFSVAWCCFSAFHGFSTVWRHFFIQLYAAGQSSLFRNSRLFHQHAIVGLISILFQDRCCASARLFPPEKAFFFRRVRLLRLMLLRHKEHFSFSSPSAAYRAEHRSFSSLSATRLPRTPSIGCRFSFFQKTACFHSLPASIRRAFYPDPSAFRHSSRFASPPQAERSMDSRSAMSAMNSPFVGRASG